MSSLTKFLSPITRRPQHSGRPVADRDQRPRAFVIIATVVTLVGVALGATAIAERHDDSRWVGTWSASPQPAQAPLQINGQTLRQVVRTSLEGKHARVRFSNAFGTDSLLIGAAHAAISSGGGAIAPGTDRALTFNGLPGITIPAGALAVSDSFALDLPALADVAVTLYLPQNVLATTEHSTGLQTTYLSGAGNFTAAPTVAGITTQSYYFLSGVEVRSSDKARAIVALGDSLTDGFGSTPDTNQRWTNLLAERLQSHYRTSRVAVLNAGISGNRMLHDFVGTSTLARLDRDVLVQAGVEYVIVAEGNNDFGIPGLIGNPAEDVTAEQVIQGYVQIIDRARAQGLRVFGGTLNPVEGITFPGFYSAALEAKRQTVNRWIRTSRAYDGVIDFDKVLRDPTHPTRILPSFDSGDHAHPNDAGYRAIANAIDLSLFRDDDGD